jgi:hypothetical protein
LARSERAGIFIFIAPFTLGPGVDYYSELTTTLEARVNMQHDVRVRPDLHGVL